MIAAAGRIHLRRATELGQVYDHGIVEHPALNEILNERAVGLVVHRANDVLHPLDRGERFGAVDIPGDLVEDREERVDRDEAHAAFHQSPRQQTALAETVHAITLADGQGFLRQIKCRPRLFAGHYAKGCVEILIEQSRVLARLEIGHGLIHNVPHLATPLEPVCANLIRRQEVRHFEILLRRIGHQREGILGFPEKAARLAVGQIATAPPHQLRQHHKRRQIRLAAHEIGGHGSGVWRVNAAGETPSRLHHLPARVMHRGTVVMARADEGKLVGNFGVERQQLGNLEGV